MRLIIKFLSCRNPRQKLTHNFVLANTKADIKGTGKLIKNKKGVQFIQVKDINVKLTSGNQKVKIISKGSRDSEALSEYQYLP